MKRKLESEMLENIVTSPGMPDISKHLWQEEEQSISEVTRGGWADLRHQHSEAKIMASVLSANSK